LTIQVVRGNQNVQIQDVHDSSIQIVFGDRMREVPLEPAVVPVSARPVAGAAGAGPLRALLGRRWKKLERSLAQAIHPLRPCLPRMGAVE
jgi:hypothetical protein